MYGQKQSLEFFGFFSIPSRFGKKSKYPGEKTGKNKSCYNIQYLSPEWAEGQNVCLDFETDGTSWNQNSTEIFVLETETDFETAKQQRPTILGLRWVLSNETLDDCSLIPKARLIVKGYLEDLPKF